MHVQYYKLLCLWKEASWDLVSTDAAIKSFQASGIWNALEDREPHTLESGGVAEPEKHGINEGGGWTIWGTARDKTRATARTIATATACTLGS